MAFLDRRNKDIRNLPGFGTTAGLAVLFLYAPIAFLALYSFNAGWSISQLEGFSLRWYKAVFANEGIQNAALNSLTVAIIASSIATVLATAAAMATVRLRFRGKEVAYGLINFPLMVPEIVTAIATLIFFAAIGFRLGLMTVIVAHIVFCIPFAYLPIRARLASMDAGLEQAARDLFARPFVAFRRITLPILMPGIVSGWLLAFIISLDDFIISAMVAGPGATTLPVHIYSMLRLGITPEVNAVSSLMILASTLLVLISAVLSRKTKT
ncbi:ABC transporter permease [uncultured Roseovarius sp.]|uniref:ABC transporter permease n=1 Tax=uncultured Roseovarius sp. TaxID=293344 RepID=UPI002636A72E|nr:ABC transporter permease [uncultured Roseovarius sp.]